MIEDAEDANEEMQYAGALLLPAFHQVGFLVQRGLAEQTWLIYGHGSSCEAKQGCVQDMCRRWQSGGLTSHPTRCDTYCLPLGLMPMLKIHQHQQHDNEAVGSVREVAGGFEIR